jgi:hypothetical protein
VERHRTDPIALLFGATFACTGLAALVGLDLREVLRLDVLGPAIAMIAGLALLLSARRGGSRSEPTDRTAEEGDRHGRSTGE